MPDANRPDVGDLNSWWVESVRATAFLRTKSAKPVKEQWKILAGAEPESTSAQPREGAEQAEGAFERGGLIVREQPDRNDLAYVSAVEDFLRDGSLGSWQTVLDKTFVPQATRWLEELGAQLSRVAFGAILRLPASDRITAYKRLGRYLVGSVTIDPETSSDFSYRINRWRVSTVVHGLNVNRLCTWAATRLTRTTMVLDAQTNTPVPTDDQENGLLPTLAD